MTEKRATIEKAERYGYGRFGYTTSTTEWVARCTGGAFNGSTRSGFKTRKAAREWADEFGYEWRENAR
jgi:hypothetical protein